MTDLSKEERQFIKRIENISFLIVDPNSSTRKGYRALLSYYLIKPTQVAAAETLEEALGLYREGKKFNILIVDASIGHGQVEQLLTEHLKTGAVGQHTGIFLATSRESDDLVTYQSDDRIDCVLPKPFNNKELQDHFFDTMSRKTDTSEYAKLLHVGLHAVKLGKAKEAIVLLSKAKALSDRNLPALVGLAEAYALDGQSKLAMASYFEVLKTNPSHTRALSGMFELCLKLGDSAVLFKIGQKLLAQRSVNDEQLVQLTKIVIAENHLAELELIQGLITARAGSYPKTIEELGKGYVKIGIACLMKNDRKLASTFFRRADHLTNSDPKILLEMIQALAGRGLPLDFVTFLNKLPPALRENPSVRVANLEEQALASDFKSALDAAMEMIRQENLRFEPLFNFALRAAARVKSDERFVAQLLDLAEKAFPSYGRQYFASIHQAEAKRAR